MGVPVGQIVGGIIEASLWLAVGVYLVWIRPWSIRRRAAEQQLDADELQAKLKKFRPQLGLVPLAFGTFQFIKTFDDAGLQLPKVAGAVIFLAGVAAAIYAFSSDAAGEPMRSNQALELTPDRNETPSP